MSARTVYGTWVNFGTGETDPETNVAVALGDHVDDFDVVGLVAAYREAIADALPEGVALVGAEFHGPWPMPEGAGDAVAEAVGSVDLWALAERFDRAEVTA